MRAVTLCLTVLLLAGHASAQDEEAARNFYRMGEEAKNAKEFEKAAKLFEKGYFALRRTAFLHNVALMFKEAGDCDRALYYYRKHLHVETSNSMRKPSEAAVVEIGDKCSDDGDSASAVRAIRSGWDAESQYRCRDAVVAYKRYLEIGSNATRTERVRVALTALERQCPEEKKPKKKEESKATSALLKRCERSLDDFKCERATTCFKRYLRKEDAAHIDYAEKSLRDLKSTCKTPGKAPKLRPGRGSFDIGAATLQMGDIDTPIVTNPSIAVSYRFLDVGVGIDAGVRVGFVPLRYTFAGESGVSTMTAITANAGFDIPIGTTAFAARGEAGIGVLIWSGLTKANPFTESAQKASGPLAMLHFRFGAFFDWHVTDRFFVTVSPFTYSVSPAKAGLIPSTIHRIDFTAGAGLRF